VRVEGREEGASVISTTEPLFPKTIDFLKMLTISESDDPNGRDWIVYADAMVGTGCLHAGHLFLLKEEDTLTTFSGMPTGMVRYLMCKVRRECERVMEAHQSPSAAANSVPIAPPLATPTE